MKLSIIVESKSIDEFEDKFKIQFEKNPCEWCLMGKGMMCVEKRFCRWHSHREIYVKQEVQEVVK
jgi:hypothetical protein